MKNQYVGDIGDYGKYGLLRFLAKYGIRIGINWYLTENDGSSDGKFTDYLKQTSERVYDLVLFDALQKIAGRPDKDVSMIEQSGLIPDAVFYSETLKSSSLEAAARELSRRLWFNNSALLLGDAELIFADPDNGISFRKIARTKDSEKFILPEEVSEYYSSGKNVVFYCHKGRRKQEAWEAAKVEIKKHIRDARLLAITFHRGTQRSYIFVLHPDCYTKYEHILTAFLDSSWGRMFTWEPVIEQGGQMSIMRSESHQEESMDIQWISGFEIRTGIDNGTIMIRANREGLLSLANQLITLAEEIPGSHIHYDENNSLEEGSAELIIEKTIANNTNKK